MANFSPRSFVETIEQLGGSVGVYCADGGNVFGGIRLGWSADLPESDLDALMEVRRDFHANKAERRAAVIKFCIRTKRTWPLPPPPDGFTPVLHGESFYFVSDDVLAEMSPAERSKLTLLPTA